MTKTDRTAGYPNARAASQAIKAAAQHAKRQGSLPIDSLIRTEGRSASTPPPRRPYQQLYDCSRCTPISPSFLA